MVNGQLSIRIQHQDFSKKSCNKDEKRWTFFSPALGAITKSRTLWSPEGICGGSGAPGMPGKSWFWMVKEHKTESRCGGILRFFLPNVNQGNPKYSPTFHHCFVIRHQDTKTTTWTKFFGRSFKTRNYPWFQNYFQKQIIHFKTQVQFSSPPPYTVLKAWKTAGECLQRCGWGGRRGCVRTFWISSDYLLRVFCILFNFFTLYKVNTQKIYSLSKRRVKNRKS